MLELQLRVLTLWWAANDQLRARVHTDDDDRGEVTSTTAMIVLLVVAAIAAGVIIATKISNNANNIPEP